MEKPNNTVIDEIYKKIDQINLLTHEDSERGKLIIDLYKILTKLLELYPKYIDLYHKLFLLSFNLLYDQELALTTAFDCHKETKDQISVVLVASIQEEFRSGITKKAIDMIHSQKKRVDPEILLFYEGMYLKSNKRPFEKKLHEAILINGLFSRAYLELSNLYENDDEKYNEYLGKAISVMEVYKPKKYDYFDMGRYFREVIFLNSITTYQMEYFKSLLKK